MLVWLNGVQVDFDTAVELMDDEIRECVAGLYVDSEQMFINLYRLAHFRKYGEEFEAI